MKKKITLNLLKIIKRKPKKLIKIWSRSLNIFKEMTAFLFGVHNGRFFVPVFITKKMIGRKLGEFSLTRKFIKHKNKLKDKKLQKKKKNDK